MKKDDCIFCKLSNGDIPTNALYEDDVVKVIFDLNPASKGHVLILPIMQTPFFNSPQFDECGGIKTDNPLPDKTVKVMSQGDKSVITAYGLMVLMVF